MTEDTQSQEIDLHNIFNKKDEVEPVVEEKKEDPKVKKEPVKEVKRESAPDLDEDDDVEKPAVKKEEKAQEKVHDYKSENENLQKTLKDTQKSFHEDRRKLSAYKRAVEKLKEEGTLLEEEANLLLDHTQYEEETHSSGSEPVLIKYGKIWDKELEYMRKYSSNAIDIDQSVIAFQHLLRSSSSEEVEDIFSDLAQYEDDEVELTKRMISYGDEYNNEIYSDIHEAGSIRKLKLKYQDKIDELEKELDKSNKKYNRLREKHQDYDSEPGNQRVSSGAGNVDHKKEVSFDIGAIFNKQYQRR